jgi:hypothetical protein
MNENYDEYVHEEGPPTRWRATLTWPGLLALAWLVFELTAQLPVAAMVVACKFGWEEIRTALWLYRIDPKPPPRAGHVLLVPRPWPVQDRLCWGGYQRLHFARAVAL